MLCQSNEIFMPAFNGRKVNYSCLQFRGTRWKTSQRNKLSGSKRRQRCNFLPRKVHMKLKSSITRGYPLGRLSCNYMICTMLNSVARVYAGKCLQHTCQPPKAKIRNRALFYMLSYRFFQKMWGISFYTTSLNLRQKIRNHFSKNRNGWQLCCRYKPLLITRHKTGSGLPRH